jgi:hypothetical protein
MQVHPVKMFIEIMISFRSSFAKAGIKFEICSKLSENLDDVDVTIPAAHRIDVLLFASRVSSLAQCSTNSRAL